MIKVTLDTNVLIAGVDGTDEEKEIFDGLILLEKKGIIDIALTTRFEQDKQKDTIPERVAKHCEAAKRFGVIAGPGRWDGVFERKRSKTGE